MESKFSSNRVSRFKLSSVQEKTFKLLCCNPCKILKRFRSSISSTFFSILFFLIRMSFDLGRLSFVMTTFVMGFICETFTVMYKNGCKSRRPDKSRDRTRKMQKIVVKDDTRLKLEIAIQRRKELIHNLKILKEEGDKKTTFQVSLERQIEELNLLENEIKIRLVEQKIAEDVFQTFCNLTPKPPIVLNLSQFYDKSFQVNENNNQWERKIFSNQIRNQDKIDTSIGFIGLSKTGKTFIMSKFVEFLEEEENSELFAVAPEIIIEPENSSSFSISSKQVMVKNKDFKLSSSTSPRNIRKIGKKSVMLYDFHSNPRNFKEEELEQTIFAGQMKNVLCSFCETIVVVTKHTYVELEERKLLNKIHELIPYSSKKLVFVIHNFHEISKMETIRRKFDKKMMKVGHGCKNQFIEEKSGQTIDFYMTQEHPNFYHVFFGFHGEKEVCSYNMGILSTIYENILSNYYNQEEVEEEEEEVYKNVDKRIEDFLKMK